MGGFCPGGLCPGGFVLISVVDSIYLDFSKAFDRVDHNILLKKKGLNITGKVLQWIKNFLKRRQQAVRIDSQRSKTKWVITGVPQGSVLGSLLFLIIMLGIDEEMITAMNGSFAEGTRLWQVIKTDFGKNILQQQLRQMYSWAERNNMHFSSGKFEHMRHGKSKE